MKSMLAEVRQIWQKRHLVFELSKADFKKRFAGSYFGVAWMFVQPIVTIAIYYIVFTMLRQGIAQNDEYPYILWMIAGIVPWFFFSEAMNMATNALVEYSYLVKKIVFQISILPIVKILSAMFIHGIFLLILAVVYILMGYGPDIYWIQILYYSFAMTVLITGLSYFAGAVNVFFRDMTQLVSVIMQFGIWVTPIMWDYRMAGSFAWLLKLNPMFYIVEGYRDCLLRKVWFWENPGQTLYFWVFTLLVFAGGYAVFKRLRPHFADIL